jgi:phosphatidylserine/phosphatidylglycerophosphate/cardiolipin synthase-like enzyme
MRPISKIFSTWARREDLPRGLSRDLGNLDALVRSTAGSAKESLLLVAPYLTADGVAALKPHIARAAATGAWIRLIMRSPAQDRFNEKALMELIEGEQGQTIENRLRVLTAVDEYAALLHAKVVVADSARGYLGSANLTHKALDANLEVGVALTRGQSRTIADLFSFLESSGFLVEVNCRREKGASSSARSRSGAVAGSRPLERTKTDR